MCGGGVGRSLHWERGLKLLRLSFVTYAISRSLHWERGLKLVPGCNAIPQPGRSLHWERGLKQSQGYGPRVVTVSLPSLGAWIETGLWRDLGDTQDVAPFIGSVD